MIKLHNTKNILKGLCYWVGYKSMLFNGAQLPELSLHSELWTLLNNNSNTSKYKLIIKPEVPYKEIKSNISLNDTDIEKCIADIVIYKKEFNSEKKIQDIKEKLSYIIEIKKYENKNETHNLKGMREDIKLLKTYKDLNSKDKNAEYYLIIVSQELFPSIFFESGEQVVSNNKREKIFPLKKKSPEEVSKTLECKIEEFQYEYVNKNRTIRKVEFNTERVNQVNIKADFISAIIVKV